VHRGALSAVVRQFDDPRSEGFGVAGRNQKSGEPVPETLGNAARVGADDRDPRSESLEGHETAGLRLGGKDEEIRVGIEVREGFPVEEAEVTSEWKRGANRRGARPVARHTESGRLAEAFSGKPERRHQRVDVFLHGEPTDMQHQHSSGRAERASTCLTPSARAEPGCVHASRSGPAMSCRQASSWSLQHAIATYMDAHPESWQGLTAFFTAKRALLTGLLEGTPFRPIRPAGTYFQLVDYGAISQSGDASFVDRLIREAKVAPGRITLEVTESGLESARELMGLP
jgi:hypothetical protein